jgi:hypothetical protein
MDIFEFIFLLILAVLIIASVVAYLLYYKEVNEWFNNFIINHLQTEQNNKFKKSKSKPKEMINLKINKKTDKKISVIKSQIKSGYGIKVPPNSFDTKPKTSENKSSITKISDELKVNDSKTISPQKSPQNLQFKDKSPKSQSSQKVENIKKFYSPKRTGTEEFLPSCGQLNSTIPDPN